MVRAAKVDRPGLAGEPRVEIYNVFWRRRALSRWIFQPVARVLGQACVWCGGRVRYRPALDGEDAAQDSVRVCDDGQILDLLRRTQELERQKGILYGLALIVLGIACGAMSRVTGGTDVQDLVSGILMGLSVGEVLVGVWAVGRQMIGK